MKSSLRQQIRQLLEKYKRQTLWKKAVSILGCLVVFCTTYALILPAITMERSPQCGMEEHTHTAECYAPAPGRQCICTPERLGIHQHGPECYDEEGNLICGYSDFVIHVHDESCYDEEGNLICTLPEIREHTHTEECYQTRKVLICGQEETPAHTHGPECYTRVRGELICGREESEGHTHGPECYATEKVLVCTEDHEHTEDCYQEQQVLICGQEETPAHTHTDECYAWHEELTCTLPEGEGHTHTDACYAEERVLVCGQPEVIAHVHGPECYDAEGNLICGLPETRTHQHSEDCFTQDAPPVLICQLPEHTHTDACYPEPAAPQELTLSQQTLQTEVEGTLVTVSGRLPEGAAVKAVPAQVQLDSAQVLLALDITIVLPDQSVYEPAEDTLSVEITAPQIPEEDCGVYYIPEDGLPEALPSQNGTGSVSFDTPHFSTYAVVLAAPPQNSRVDGGPIPDPRTGADSGLSWELTADQNGNHTLTIRGSGPMPDYITNVRPPWYEKYSRTPLKLIFEEGITRVGSSSFSGMDLTRGISFSSTIEVLGARCFNNSRVPQTIVFPGTIHKLEERVLQYCIGLETAVLNEGLECIGTAAFGTAGGLVTLPATVRQVDSFPFLHVTDYAVAPGNPYLKAVDGILYSLDGTVLVDYPKDKVLENYVIPDTVTTIMPGAFQCVSDGRRITFPASVNQYPVNMGSYSAIREFYFEDGTHLNTTRNIVSGTRGLTGIRWPENTPFVMDWVFYGGSYPEVESYRFPTGVTEIKNLGHPDLSFPALQTVSYDAVNAEISADRPVMGNAIYDLIIGPHVDRLNAGFAHIAGPARSIRLEGPNQITVAPDAFAGVKAPFGGLSGEIWVSEQGVLYSCDPETRTSRLLYVPGDIRQLTVPASIPMQDGGSFPVTGICRDAVKLASGLESITFADPSAITGLDPYALANCPGLTSVNGASTLKGAADSFTNPAVKIGANAFYNTGLGGSSGPDSFAADMNGKPELLIRSGSAPEMNLLVASQNSTMEWKPRGDDPNVGGYTLLTGDTLTITASVGNTAGDVSHSYRIYLQSTGDDCRLSIAPGHTYTFDGQDVVCCATPDPNIVYLSFLPKVGGTISIPVTALYPSPDSPGGGLTVWGVITDGQQPGDDLILQPADGTIQASWATVPDPFVLTKEALSASPVALTGSLVTGPDGVPVTVVRPAGRLSWRLNLTRSAESSSSYGKDYASGIEFADRLTLPAGVSWDPRVLDAIRNGDISNRGGSLYLGETLILQMDRPGALSGLRLTWDEEQQTPVLHWLWSNTDLSSEINAMNLPVHIEPAALLVDLTRFDPETDPTVHNQVTATVHYTHSTDRTLSAEAQLDLGSGNGRIKLNKTGTDAEFFGEDITYTLQLYNDGGLPWLGKPDTPYTLLDTLSDLTWISPDNMTRMFEEADAAGTPLTITIQKAALAPWQPVTAVDGSPAWQNSGNSNLGTEENTLSVSAVPGGYQAAVQGEPAQIFTAPTVAQALQKAGYAPTRAAAYQCRWQLHPEDTLFTLDGGRELDFHVYATAKDSPGILSRDWPNEYPNDNPVSFTNRSGLVAGGLDDRPIVRSDESNSIRREALVCKSLSVNGVDMTDRVSLSDGDVLDYSVSFDHFGTGSYQNLPLVDEMTGSQLLLAPVKTNPGLADKGLETLVLQDTAYYKLTPGVYHDVQVGIEKESGRALTADTVTVAPDENGQLSTRIQWYFASLPGEDYRLLVEYKALADFRYTDGLLWSMGNTVWVNDRTDCRLYSSLFGSGTILDFAKDIVLERGSTPDQDVLAPDQYLAVSGGDTVTYRLQLQNTGFARYVLTGSNIADALPHTFGTFSWTEPGRVTGVDVVTRGEGITHSGLENWYLSDEPYGGLLDEGREYIRWPDETRIEFTQPSFVYLYFTLTYPENESGGTDLWSRYAAAAGGNSVDNILYVYRFSSSVTHDLREPGRVLLQKGVTSMHYSSDETARDAKATGTSLQYYNNRDSKYRSVMYYVTLYNGGSNRLYLDTLYDQLPRGFTFARLRADPNVTDFAVHSLMLTEGGTNVQHVAADLPAGTVLRSASITANAVGSTLSFEIGAGQGDYALRYDETRNQYYLNRGEALVFGYLCDIGPSASTDNLAVNTIAMHYTDHLNSGVTLLSPGDYPVTAAQLTEHPYSDRNDGSCRIVTDQQLPPAFPRKDGSWLASDVSMQRGNIIPGVVKVTDSYEAANGEILPYENSVFPDSTVTWKLDLKNTGMLSLADYTFTDVMPAPYQFTGKVSLTLYDGWNRPVRDETLFEILSRTPETITLKYPTSGTYLSQAIPLDGSVVALRNDLKVSFGLDGRGNEVLTVHLPSVSYAIPEAGGRARITLSGKNTTGNYQNAVYTNRATLIPDQQDFDRINDGSLVPASGTGRAGVTNSAPVTVAFGYATSSQKSVAETADPNNRAVSTRPDANRILLPGRDSRFTYGLTVNNDTEKAMTKLVLIDNLPDVGDTTPFDPTAFRSSAFPVWLAPEPNFSVTVTRADSTRTLDPGQYRVEYSTSVDFGGPQSADWRGEPSAKWTAEPVGARSFRILLEDPSASLIPSKASVTVTFDAVADPAAPAGAVAWNSFGYHYGLADISTELEAMPLVVGVQLPALPQLQKQLVNLDGQPLTAPENLDFIFELSDPGNPELTPQRITLTVPAGQSQASLALELPGWTWETGRRYLLRELPGEGAPGWGFRRWQGGTLRPDSAVEFLYTPDASLVLTCTNVQQNWALELTKTDRDTGKKLDGAWFALYSPNADDAMDPADYTGPQPMPAATLELDTETWYLADVQTPVKGKILWDDLIRDNYYLVEFLAPEGYYPGTDPIPVSRSGPSVALTVTNTRGYALPQTGGSGTLPFTLGGLLLMAAALIFGPALKRKQERRS